MSRSSLALVLYVLMARQQNASVDSKQHRIRKYECGLQVLDKHVSPSNSLIFIELRGDPTPLYASRDTELCYTDPGWITVESRSRDIYAISSFGLAL
jgi:hypothetical protein